MNNYFAKSTFATFFKTRFQNSARQCTLVQTSLVQNENNFSSNRNKVPNQLQRPLKLISLTATNDLSCEKFIVYQPDYSDSENHSQTNLFILKLNWVYLFVRQYAFTECKAYVTFYNSKQILDQKVIPILISHTVGIY